jgi:signal transduction histidine kinase
MSHELRTPLNAILGFTGTLLMQLPGPLNADQEKQLGTIQSSARHLLSLINDLLDVEKIESGKFQVQLEEVVLQSLIHEVFETLQPLAAQKKLGFKLSLPKADIRVLTDRRAVHQMLINLLNNAIKFTEHGQVSLQVSRRRTGASGTVELLVADTGIGIKPELQGQLFQAFTQLDGTSTRNFHGTGLGLYLSRRLATLVGGNLHCESQYGKGSVFTLALPVQRT